MAAGKAIKTPCRDNAVEAEIIDSVLPTDSFPQTKDAYIFFCKSNLFILFAKRNEGVNF